MKVLVAGELNPDLIMQDYHQFPALGKEVLVDDLVLTLGSSSAICAAGLARLGNEVSFVGKVGLDPWGDFCIESLHRLGVDTSLVIRDARVKTGITVSLSSAKDRALVTYLGAISQLSANDVRGSLPGYDHLHVSSFYMQEALRPDCAALFAAAHELGLTTSLDPGYDPSEQWKDGLHAALASVDVFLPNEVELAAITGIDETEDALRALATIAAEALLVAKLGSDGAAGLWANKFVRIQGYSVDTLDTTGAGDSFNAGFLHTWLRKQPVDEALRFACACGALSTLGIGGTGSQATEQQANELMRSK